MPIHLAADAWAGGQSAEFADGADAADAGDTGDTADFAETGDAGVSADTGDFADTGEVADFADTGEATFFTGVCVAADAGEFADGALLPETAALPSDWETGATAAEPKADPEPARCLYFPCKVPERSPTYLNRILPRLTSPRKMLRICCWAARMSSQETWVTAETSARILLALSGP